MHFRVFHPKKVYVNAKSNTCNPHSFDVLFRGSLRSTDWKLETDLLDLLFPSQVQSKTPNRTRTKDISCQLRGPKHLSLIWKKKKKTTTITTTTLPTPTQKSHLSCKFPWQPCILFWLLQLTVMLVSRVSHLIMRITTLHLHSDENQADAPCFSQQSSKEELEFPNVPILQILPAALEIER